MIKALKTLTVLFTTALFALNVHAQQIDQDFSDIDKIEISTGSSDCVVKQGQGTDVNVKLHHDRGENFKPSVKQSGTKLTIRENSQGRNNGDATWTLSVPNGIRIDFNTGSGNFSANGLDIELSLNAGSGDFELEELKGTVKSNAGSGDLEVNNFKGNLHSNVGSGDLSIDSATGELHLNAGSGDIEMSEIAGQIDANVGSGDIEVDNITIAGDSKFNSGSGDVQIGLKESLKHNISLNSGSGDAILDFNGNKIDGVVVMTADKLRGEISAPFPFDKEEEIDNGGNTTIKKTAKLGTGSVKIKIGTGSGEASISN